MEFNGTDKKNKAERGKKGIRGPTVEGLFREGECNHHFSGSRGGSQGGK